jgi:hypothetical protein
MLNIINNKGDFLYEISLRIFEHNSVFHHKL